MSVLVALAPLSNAEPIKQTIYPSSTNVKIIFTDMATINKKCKQHNLVVGCAIYTRPRFGTNICTIYVRKPQDTEDNVRFMILGHELLHCTMGDFHTP